MNRQIVKLFGFILVLYTLLFGFTSYWSIFDADSLEANNANRRPLLEEQRIRRGTVFADDGRTQIAVSRPQGQGNNQIYVRHYPHGALYGNPIGYSFVERGRVGFEQSHNDELVGNKTEFLSVLDELQGHKQEGEDIVSSLNAEAQEAAVNGLGGRRGAVVAMVPSTGEIKAMVSIPEYDPNVVRNSKAFQRLNTDDSAPLFNRATQAGYPPGSTMKVVTATAGLDSGELSPSSTFSGRSPIEIEGVPLSNSGGEQFGTIDMTTALTNSVNTWWAQAGEKLGNDTMFKYMDRFGFNQKPQLDLPGFQLTSSGVYDGARLLDASDRIDIGRVAIGQERLRVTPLQMAEVAAAVANDGQLMEPRLWSKVIDPDGRETKLDPARQSKVMSEDTASKLNTMMQSVVREGTGTAAAVSGIDVAGKTGTAELSPGVNDAWFIGFAPATDPKIAIACIVEHTSGFGGPTCGPIFKAVAETILNGRTG
ncbi:MAG TPA: penicillin-binding transpeptidase domain-containing protein [Solirubrobacterales bacterium]|nr:penicillin-binding transpeptidase domain-containing protein [Solirubrobacterales bacterium]